MLKNTMHGSVKEYSFLIFVGGYLNFWFNEDMKPRVKTDHAKFLLTLKP